MTVSTHLTTTASSLVLSENEKTSVSRSITTLSARLNTYFDNNITSHFQFGSNTRGTILPRKADSNSDIDYMVVFDTSDGQKKPQTYLDRLRRFADAKYSTSEIHQSSPTIVLSLNHIKFELVPAIYNYKYQIPSPSTSWQEWIDTDPSGANQKIQDKNKEEHFQIKPLVRLIKYWNATQGPLFTSFSIEEYIVGKYFMSCTTLREYFYAFWNDFNCSYDSSQNIKDRVARAKKYAENAKKYENNGMPVTAETEIKKIIPTL